MTDLEKLSRPVTYSVLPGYSTILYQGVSIDRFGASLRYLFCVEFETKNLSQIKCYSFLTTKGNPIASFKVKKLHDTR